VKWWYFLNALAKCGALKDMVITGKTDKEKLESIARSLIGMEFRFVELTNLESMITAKKLEAILPDEYYGRKEIKPSTAIKTEVVSEEGPKLG